MDEVITYSKQENQVNEWFTLKEKIAFTLLSGLAIGAGVHFGIKYFENRTADKSNAQSFEAGTAASIAKDIKMCFENDGNLGTDTPRLRTIMTQLKSQEQWNQISKEYQKQNPKHVLEQDLEIELQSSERMEMMAIKDGKPKREGEKVPGQILYDCWARRLKAGFDKTYSFIPGTDEDCVATALREIPTQRAFINVGVSYYKQFKRNLMPDMKEEFNTFTYPTYLAMITNKPKA